MPSLAISHESELAEAEVQRLHGGVAAADPPAAGARDYKPLVLTLRNAERELVGGLLGATIWGWLHVDTLWVAPPLRGLGYGGRLLAAGERTAGERGCTHARLDTFDFQARGFYERHGYTVYAELAGFPPGHTQYHMRKLLSPAS